MSAVLQLSGVKRTFQEAGRQLEVLKGVDLTLREGEIVGLLGASGSGKSTLLHIAGLLESQYEGTLKITGKSGKKLSAGEGNRARRTEIGFVYQFHHLLAEFTALENIMIPMRIAGTPKERARERAKTLLSAVGLLERADHLPSKLSGGEQQRIAIARAMANSPKIILADEPTGNLDEATGTKVMDYLIDTIRAGGAAALIATHNAALARRFDRSLLLQDGKVKPHK